MSNPYLIFLALPAVMVLTVLPFKLWDFICHLDRIGREAAAPLSRAFGLSLLAIAVILILFAPKA